MARLKFGPRSVPCSAAVASPPADAEPAAEPQAYAPTVLGASCDDQACANDAPTTHWNPLPPTLRRVAVHGVLRTPDAGIAHCYGVFVYDTAGHEHALAQFADAASATFAALRLGQMYRVGVEFGNFSDPKSLRQLRD